MLNFNELILNEIVFFNQKKIDPSILQPFIHLTPDTQHLRPDT